MANIAVVIVTFNRLALLKECIQAVIDQTHPAYKTIIVNNASTDGTYEYLCGLKDNPSLMIDHQEKNLGGAGGFERGLKLATEGKKTADWFLIIDDDAIIEKDFLARVSDMIEKKPEIKAFSGTVYCDGEIDPIHRKRLITPKDIANKYVPVEEYEKDCFAYDLSTFCGLVVAKEVIKKIGLPRGDFFIWYDDTEYSLRIRKYSKIVNVNAAKLNHKTVRVSETNKYLIWKNYYMIRNRLDIMKNHFGFSGYMREMAINIRWLLVDSIKILYKKDEEKKHLMGNRTLRWDAVRAFLSNEKGRNAKY